MEIRNLFKLIITCNIQDGKGRTKNYYVSKRYGGI